ncbi:hypothetical protein N7530_011184 [Penicillium desertorum]|uniref:Uncharacterized protein n=1 Tax=Penicillium desertorum TaxID=1303715 RepID=A0A9W9WH76_9EURO|nr:hypothetical protein N7530_011184 [Penicillium desertorum]
MSDMEIQVAAQTRTALKANLTLRCVLRDKYRHTSRRSADVIPWAQSRVERLSNALNVIQMLGLRNIVYIFYDLFLHECDKQVRTEITESFSKKRPIHMITRKGKVYIMRRDKRRDEDVANQYTRKSSIDKGPLPYFSDLTDPPFYSDGRRIERWEEGYVPVAEMVREDRRRRQEEADEKRRQDEPDDKTGQDKQ